MNERAELKCFNCGGKGHVATRCPSKTLAAMGTHDQRISQGGEKRLTCKGMVEQTPVEDIVLDTGCSRTMVQAVLVPETKVSTSKMVTIWCAHGQVEQYPTAKVEILVKGVHITVEAAVCKTLPVSVL